MGLILDKRMTACSAAVAAAAAAIGGTASTSHAALITTTGSGGGGTAIQDGSGHPTAYFEADATSGATNPPTAGDTGEHVYLKLNGNTTGTGLNNTAFVVTAGDSSGVLANLPGGTVVGPSSLYSSNSYYQSNTSQNSDLAYIDTTTGLNYTPAGNTPDQFSLNAPGFFGVSLTPDGGTTTDYGYVAITLTPNGTGVNVTETLTYDNTGAAVTIPGGTSVPEPASLSLLAVGAVGVLRRRKA